MNVISEYRGYIIGFSILTRDLFHKLVSGYVLLIFSVSGGLLCTYLSRRNHIRNAVLQPSV